MKIPQIGDLKLDNKKIILTALGILFIVYIDYSFVIKMQLANLRDLKPKVAKLKKDIAAFNKDYAVMNSLKDNQGKTGAADKQAISEDDLPDLLEYISNVGNNHTVKIMQIKSSREAKAKEDKLPHPAAKSSPVYISLDVFSSYHNLGAFINVLENSDKFIAVEDIKVSRDKNDYMRQEASLTLKTYVKK
jgi:Tfp pilus assembly protein PilO